MKLTQEQLDALRAVPIGSMPNKLRIALALSKTNQVALVKATGIHRGHLSNLVRGCYVSVTVETARKLADSFGCHIEDLFPVPDQSPSLPPAAALTVAKG